MENLVLKNNLKPATHFIEVYSNGRESIMWPKASNIDELERDLTYTRIMPGIYTVAIFKIRLK